MIGQRNATAEREEELRMVLQRKVMRWGLKQLLVLLNRLLGHFYGLFERGMELTA